MAAPSPPPAEPPAGGVATSPPPAAPTRLAAPSPSPGRPEATARSPGEPRIQVHGIRYSSSAPERVVTSSGRSLECDFAVVGIGTIPLTDVLEGTPVKLANGIVVVVCY